MKILSASYLVTKVMENWMSFQKLMSMVKVCCNLHILKNISKHLIIYYLFFKEHLKLINLRGWYLILITVFIEMSKVLIHYGSILKKNKAAL